MNFIDKLIIHMYTFKYIKNMLVESVNKCSSCELCLNKKKLCQILLNPSMGCQDAPYITPKPTYFLPRYE